MATEIEVLEMLIPNGGWVITGNDYDGIEFLECEPITKEDFTNGFALVDVWKAQQATEKATEKAALLAKLGITAEEAKLLLS
jgi:hypothetical protein